MAIINGTEFLLYEGSDVIGHSTNCAFNLNQDLPDSTTKNSNGWSEVISGLRSAEITVEGLTDYSDVCNFELLADRIITRARMFYIFKSNGAYYFGNGFIASVDEVADMEASITYTVTLTIDGRFTRTTEDLDGGLDSILDFILY